MRRRFSTRWGPTLLAGAVVSAVASVVLALAAPAQATPPAAGGDEEGLIAFVRGGQVHTMGATGEDVTPLTSGGKNYRPEWSPDGQRISYIHERRNGRRDVWVMSADGGGKQPITTTGDVTSAGATWSPDGSSLAYAADGVLKVVAASRGATPTTPDGFESNSECAPQALPRIQVDRYLAWSPDGGTIAVYNRNDCFFDYAIWWFHPDTGEAFQYLALGADCCGYARWTEVFWGPDGEFGYTEQDGGQYGISYGPRRIVYPGFASRAGDTGGSVSPSGSSLVLTKKACGKPRVVRATIDGAQRQRLAVGYQADWQPVTPAGPS